MGLGTFGLVIGMESMEVTEPVPQGGADKRGGDGVEHKPGQSWAWWHMSIITVTWETEVGGLQI